jgi:hypothetical protein
MVSVWMGVSTVAVVAMMSGCEGKCSGTYNCPEISNTAQTSISVPSSLSGQLVSVTTTGPCTTNFTTGDSEGSVGVTGSSPGTCQVRGMLADGSDVQATLAFQSVDLMCCGSTLRLVGSPPTFVPTDAGSP